MPAKMRAAVFDALLEYSCTIPDGKTIGKRWKRREPYGAPVKQARWFMGEYVPDPDPKLVYIIWTEVERVP
jgi:hypothetical protein